jgi:TonB family protein
MNVSDILRDRMQPAPGLQRMTAISIAAHVAAVALMVFVPGGLLSRPSEAPRSVMTISLSGNGEGARTTGMTAIGGRPVQTTQPAEKREPIRAPAAKAPEMTLPTPKARPSKAPPAPKIEQAPQEARGRTPTRGAEVAPGTAVAETGARGMGFGLSSGGGAGSGSFLDVSNFCCPDYIAQMIERVRQNWVHNNGIAGVAIVKFTIQRNGAVTNISLERSSGTPTLDFAAERALYNTKNLSPLPAEFTNPTLTVNLTFEYQR